MKITNIIKSVSMAAVIATMAGVSSCDYLEVVPPEQPNLVDAMKTYDRARGFLYSCYNGIVGGNGNNDYTIYYLGEVNSTTDEYFMPYTWNNDNPVLRGTLENTQSGTTGISDQWNKWYTAIGQCLLFEEQLNTVGREYNVASESEMTEWLAETRFLKAFYHWSLLRRYGPIPLTKERKGLNTGANDIPGRSHFTYCVEYICHEMEEAAKNLPATRPESEIGRATSTICKAIIGKIRLYAASPLWNGSFPTPQWRNTKWQTPADDELGTPDFGYELVPTSYDASKWDVALAANLEALALAEGAGNRSLFTDTTTYHRNDLDLPYVPFDAPEGFKQKVMLMRYLNTLRENEGNREIIFSSSEGIHGGSLSARLPHRIIKMNNGTYYDHWQGISPSVYTVEHFNTVNGYLPENDPDFYAEDEWYTSAGLRGQRGNIIKLCTNREPRFYAWIGFDGGDYGSRVVDNQSPLVLNMRDPEKQGYAPGLYNRDFSPAGFLTMKWLHPAAYFTAGGQSNTYNTATYPIMRLAELYLNIAECYAAKGDVENACRYLNPIRNRAGVPDLTPAMVSATGMPIMEWVRNERFIELWNESNRFFDIRRWVKGEELLGYGKREVLNAQVEAPSFEEFNQVMPLNFPYTWGRKLYVYPVWYHELARNPQLVQAPGF